MPIETLLPRPEAPLPSPPAVAETPSLRADTPAPPHRPGRSLQDRRLRAARDLDSRLLRLEQDIALLSPQLLAARQASSDTLRELQQRSASLTSEVLRLAARLARQGREQDQLRREVDLRLAGRLREMEAGIVALETGLQAQSTLFKEIEERHATLARLHEHLERVVQRQGRSLDIVTAEFEQRIELLRATLDGVQQLCGEQQAAQIRLGLDHEALAIALAQTTARIEALEQQVGHFQTDTRQRLLALARTTAALAMIGASVAAWGQWQLLAQPRAFQKEIATLRSEFTLQRQHELQQAALLSGQATALDALARQLQLARDDNRRLRLQAQRQARRLARLDARVIALASSATPTPTPTPTSSATATATATATSLPTSSATSTSTSASSPRPGDETNMPITLPPALAGSRPDF